MVKNPASFLLLSILFLINSIEVKGQHHCGFDGLHQKMLEEDSAYQIQHKYITDFFQKKESVKQPNANKSSTELVIPVVVHVIYGSEEADHNISDEQVRSGIQRLNEVFSNSDGFGVAANIRFELAQRTPDCQSTNGIIRIDGSGVTDYATEGIDIESSDTDGNGAKRIDVLSLSRWNPQEYLNIWIVNEISNNNASSGIQAFATFPGTNFRYDGIVILYNAFGFDYDNCNCYELKPYTDENEILVHELGHYLGLYHTFEGDAGGTACPSTLSSSGDQVADTPAHIRTFSCLTGSNSCYNAGDAFADIELISHNYMGYAPESCQSEFTQGQVDRMRSTLEEFRPNLLTSNALLPINTTNPLSFCSPQSLQGTAGEYGMGIINVQIGTLQTGSGSTFQDGGYLDQWCNTAVMKANTSYDINIETFGHHNEDLKVYLDYDNDGSFAEEEQIFESYNKYIHQGTFTTPEVVLTETPLRIRVISDHYQYNISSGCYAPTYGQVEDYSLIFSNETPAQIERGLSLVLDGMDDYLQTDFAPDPATESFTYAFWCKPSGEPSNCQVVFDRVPSDFSTFNFMAIWYGRIFIYLDQTLLFMDDLPLEYDNWYYIAYTWDGEYQKLYVNGKLTGSKQVEQVMSNEQALGIGAFYQNFLRFEGEIDELRLWSTAKTGAQIREQMHQTSGLANDDSMTYFHFNDSIENNEVLDFSLTKTATTTGQPSLTPSTINAGSEVAFITLQDIQTSVNLINETVGITSNFLEIAPDVEVTLSKHELAVNTLNGISAATIYEDQYWTLCVSDRFDFTVTLSFHNDSPIFTDLNSGAYKLYHRAVGSDGDWQILLENANAVTNSSVTFSGINTAGQFIIAKE